MADITITLPDGSGDGRRRAPPAADLAAAIGRGLAKAAVDRRASTAPSATSTGPLADGDRGRASSPTTSDRGLDTIRHSTAHVLAQAVLDLFPGATFAIGPPVEDGFYYDFELPDGGARSRADDLERIEARMREIIAEDQPFVRDELADRRAPRAVRATTRTSCEIIDGEADDPTSDGEPARPDLRVQHLPQHRPSFIDLCRGPHVPAHRPARALQADAGRRRLLARRREEPDAAAHLRHGVGHQGDSTTHLHRLEEAEKRDHRKLGVELDLFSFPEEIGSGLAVFHPKGGIVRRLMEDYSPAAPRGGRLRVRLHAPHHQGRAVRDLAATSTGTPTACSRRWSSTTKAAGTEYYLKPMNCPFHILIFKSRAAVATASCRCGCSSSARSTATRSRAWCTASPACRGFTQDDAHIFTHQGADGRRARARSSTSCSTCCATTASTTSTSSCRPSPTRSRSAPTRSGRRPPRRCAQVAPSTMDLELVLDEGGGAFYGPKISVQARDAIGRTWQMSTIQVDFQLPQRFDLEYVGADGERHRPIMIHRALFGSVERFFAVLVEHYAGAFPAWLAPGAGAGAAGARRPRRLRRAASSTG